MRVWSDSMKRGEGHGEVGESGKGGGRRECVREEGEGEREQTMYVKSRQGASGNTRARDRKKRGKICASSVGGSEREHARERKKDRKKICV